MYPMMLYKRGTEMALQGGFMVDALTVQNDEEAEAARADGWKTLPDLVAEKPKK